MCGETPGKTFFFRILCTLEVVRDFGGQNGMSLNYCATWKQLCLCRNIVMGFCQCLKVDEWIIKSSVAVKSNENYGRQQKSEKGSQLCP